MSFKHRIRKPTDKEKEIQGGPKFANHINTKMEGVISCGDDVYCLI